MPPYNMEPWHSEYFKWKDLKDVRYMEDSDFPLSPVKQVKGFRTSLQNMPLWHVGYFVLKAIEAPVGFRETFAPPLTTWKNLKIGSLSKNKSYYPRYTLSDWHICTAEQASNYRASAPPLLPCDLPSSPLKAQAPNPFLGSWWHVYFILPFCLWTSQIWWGSCMYEIKCDFCLLICLVDLRLARRTFGRSFEE